MIIPGSASQSLAASLADTLDEPLATVETDRFADGEFKCRVPDAAGDRAVVVASTVSATAHLELLQLQDLASEAFDEVVTVLPYMGYARQDRAFRDGEPVSARAVARAVSTGTDRVVVVNPHEPAVCDFFDVPAEAVDAAPRLADPLPALDDPLFLAPDEGAIDLAGTVRDAYGTGSTDYFEKTRDYDTGEVTVEPSDTDVAGRDVVLVDDIVATGSTMSSAIAQLHDHDVGTVHVTCVHPMLADNARTKLANAGVASLHGTDTVERPVSSVSVAPILADRL
jgi:ribose-phosphate pyrophosphokinase